MGHTRPTGDQGFTFLEIMIGLGMLLFFMVFAVQMTSVAAGLAADNRDELQRVYWGRAAVEIVMEVAREKPDDFFKDNPGFVEIEDLTVGGFNEFNKFNILRLLDQKVLASIKKDGTIEVSVVNTY